MDDKGRFVVIEGIDGSGISTQTELLRIWCERHGVSVFVTKEPSDGPLGAQLKVALGKRTEFSPTVMALLFAADRIDHVEWDISRRIDEGTNVISDRYYLSSLAYQGEQLKDVAWLRKVNAHALTPDLTLFLDVPVEQCLQRWHTDVWRSHDRLQLYEDEETLRRVRARYLETIEMLRNEGERIEIVNGQVTVHDVHKSIVLFAAPLLEGGDALSAPLAAEQVRSIVEAL